MSTTIEVMTMPVPVIEKWAVDFDGGWLTIQVKFPSPIGRMLFVRCQWDSAGNSLTRNSSTPDSQRKWVWAQMAEGKPVVRVDESGWEILDGVVKRHSVLTHINDHWGIE